MAGWAIYAFPAVAAAACPHCYGMTRVAPDLIVDADTDQGAVAALGAMRDEARATTLAFFGAVGRTPVVVVCESQGCDRKLGGRGARAVTYSTPFATIIRVSPHGRDATIFTHEFAHVALHGRVGLRALLRGAVPAWLDEGVAVVVSNDARYLRPGTKADERCMSTTIRALPETAWDWAPAAGRDPSIYADAACRVMRWMEAHGGRQGLLEMLDAVGAGRVSRIDDPRD